MEGRCVAATPRSTSEADEGQEQQRRCDATHHFPQCPRLMRFRQFASERDPDSPPSSHRSQGSLRLRTEFHSKGCTHTRLGPCTGMTPDVCDKDGLGGV